MLDPPRFLDDRGLNGTDLGSNSPGRLMAGAAHSCPAEPEDKPPQPDQTLLMAFVRLPNSPGPASSGTGAESWGRQGLPGAGAGGCWQGAQGGGPWRDLLAEALHRAPEPFPFLVPLAFLRVCEPHCRPALPGSPSLRGVVVRKLAGVSTSPGTGKPYETSAGPSSA